MSPIHDLAASTVDLVRGARGVRPTKNNLLAVERSFSIGMPVDDDGFLRRECPNCEREFKWRPSPEGENGEPMPDAGYACPYCTKRAPADQWWTKAQVEYVSALAMSEIVGSELGSLERDADPNALISFEIRVEKPKPPAPLEPESNDMRRVDFGCHPVEPIKIADDWRNDVHCIICGGPSG